MRKAIREPSNGRASPSSDVASSASRTTAGASGFASANDMLQNYRTEYKAAPPVRAPGATPDRIVKGDLFQSAGRR